MARGESRDAVLPSVLDRLLDDEPDETRERAKSPAQQLRELRAGVLRDVTNLLNTRRRVPVLPPGLPELAPSVVDYGLLDFVGAELSSAPQREAFRRSVEEALRRYEPRFKSVRVHLLVNAEARDRTLRFRVDALLHADPVPEPMLFDSIADPATGGFDVGEAQG